MSGLARLTLWLRALLRRRHVESELDRELRLHLELETEENVRRGMTPNEARRRALVSFGGVEQTKEAVRDERETRWLDEISADVRYALRGFRRQPWFAATAVLLLALGIGANVAIFSVVHRLILRPLPFPDGPRMVFLQRTSGHGALIAGSRRQFIDDWRARARRRRGHHHGGRRAVRDRRYGSVAGARLGRGDSARGTRVHRRASRARSRHRGAGHAHERAARRSVERRPVAAFVRRVTLGARQNDSARRNGRTRSSA